MKIDDSKVIEYLNGNDLSHYSDEWFFTDTRKYTAPPDDSKVRDGVCRQYELIMNHLREFIPLNESLLDELFHGWKDIEIFADLIVGFPSPYDAVAEKDPDGRMHIILDVLQFYNYGLNDEQSRSAIKNLFTHEMVHVYVEHRFPGITDLPEHAAYKDAMDAIVFNEGIAHLLSYRSREINETDWADPELKEIYRASRDKLKEALDETDQEKQKAYLEQAVTGSYFDKFGAMSGMMYLADRWQQSGALGLKAEMSEGYRHFTDRILSKA